MVTVTEAGMVSVGPPGGPTLIRPRPGVMSMRTHGTVVLVVPKHDEHQGKWILGSSVNASPHQRVSLHPLGPFPKVTARPECTSNTGIH